MQTKGWLVACAILLVLGIVLGGAGWWYFFDKPERERATVAFGQFRSELESAHGRVAELERRHRDIEDAVRDSAEFVGRSTETANSIATRNERIIGLLNVCIESFKRFREILYIVVGDSITP